MKMAKFITGYDEMPHRLSFQDRSTTGLMDTLKTIRQTFEKGDSLQKSTGKNTTFRKLKEATLKIPKLTPMVRFPNRTGPDKETENYPFKYLNSHDGVLCV